MFVQAKMMQLFIVLITHLGTAYLLKAKLNFFTEQELLQF